MDTSWCPVCSREILPKRYQVPIAPPMQAQPAPPPSSPSSTGDAPRRTKSAARKGGLARGTGRVRPNGAVKAAEPAPKPAPAPLVPAAPIRMRTIIDQSPLPLYCSDACRLSDTAAGFMDGDFDPSRDAAVPVSPWAATAEESDSSSSGTSSDASTSSWGSAGTKVSASGHASASMATLAALYNFPPMPAPAPIIEEAPPAPAGSEYNFNEYGSGVMMAARRIRAALCPEAAKGTPFAPAPTAPAQRGPIKGWTDGSADWRNTVYSLSTAQPRTPLPFSATPANTTTEAPAAQPAQSEPARPAPLRKNSAELYAKYPLSSTKRSESRTSLYTAASTTSLPPSSASSMRSAQRQRTLLKKGAEGKLLVPDVCLKARSPSAASFASSGSSPQRSPLSRHGSDVSEESTASSAQRKVPETRSWSYDNLQTYPAMCPPGAKVKTTQLVDGELREVEVSAPLKRLFLFADKEVR
ncbi:hypothetical protein HWV62_3897 [Athelia sp. TMB]|nr:hypothetical protein HWV62_3897 [Athelia sp. TMB]